MGNINAYNLFTVTELMVHGNIMQYIKTTNWLKPVTVPLPHMSTRLTLSKQLHRMARGLGYVYDAYLTYGDLKGVRTSVSFL